MAPRTEHYFCLKALAALYLAFSRTTEVTFRNPLPSSRWLRCDRWAQRHSLIETDILILIFSKQFFGDTNQTGFYSTRNSRPQPERQSCRCLFPDPCGQSCQDCSVDHLCHNQLMKQAQQHYPQVFSFKVHPTSFHHSLTFWSSKLISRMSLP